MRGGLIIIPTCAAYTRLQQTFWPYMNPSFYMLPELLELVVRPGIQVVSGAILSPSRYHQ